MGLVCSKGVVMSAEFANKVVVVTGAAHGIGACIAHTFIEKGAIVVFTDRDESAGREREKLLLASSASAQALFIPADLSDADQAKRFIQAVLQTYPLVTLLINNAGIMSSAPLLKRSVQEWDNVINVNLRAAYLCSQLLAESLTTTKGNIINIASTRALMSEPDTEPYAASKGGLVSLTHALAVTLGKFGIRVNGINPGWIETGEWHLPPCVVQLRDIDHQQHPVGRVGLPQDIANACLFLGSNEMAGFITGHHLTIDGGMTKKMIYM